MTEVKFGEEAVAEYIEALHWYRERSARAAAGFEAAIAHTVERISLGPEQFPRCDVEGYRYAIVARYPYSLIYRIASAGAQVIAVAHAHRKPAYWADRL